MKRSDEPSTAVADDIVKRLRRISSQPLTEHANIIAHAADEIERLRADVDGYASAFDVQDEEIERLRKALRDIADLPAGAPTNDSTRLAARLALQEEATA